MLLQPFSLMIRMLSQSEAYSYFIASQHVSTLLFYALNNTISPLYYILMHFWIQLFGKGEIVLRSTSLISFAVFIYILHHFFTEHLNILGKKGYLFLLFFVLNPIFLYFAMSAEPYMLFIALLSLSNYFLLQKKYTAYLIVSILAGLSHYSFLLIVLIQGMYVYKTNKKAFPIFMKYVMFVCLVISIVAVFSSISFIQFLLILPNLLWIIIAFVISFLSMAFYQKKIQHSALIIFSLFVFLYSFSGLFLSNFNTQDIRVDFKSVLSIAQKRDVLYIMDEKNYYQALYYFGSAVYIYKLKGIEMNEIYTIPENKFVSSLPSYPNKAFIFRSDGVKEARTIQ